MKPFSNTGHETMKDSDPCEMKSKPEEPYNCCSFLSSENFQAMTQGRETHTEADDYPKLRIQRWEPTEAKAARVGIRAPGYEDCTEKNKNLGDSQWVPVYSLAEYWPVHVCDKTTQSQKYKLAKGVDGAFLKTPIELGIDPVPTSQRGTPHNPWGIASSAQKSFA